MNTRRQKIRRLCECSMMIALATVLSMIKIYEAPWGGSVTLFSMVPILICGYVYGAKTGFATAFVYSVIQLLFGIGTVAYVPDPLGIVLCILLDYTFAFTVLGIAGLFRKLHLTASEEKNRYINLTLGSLSALILRFALHILSGAVVWYAITKEGAWNDAVFKYSKWVYSVVYNSAFMVPEIILTVAAVPVAVYLVKLVWCGRTASKKEKSNATLDRLTLVKLILGGITLVGGILLLALLSEIVALVGGILLLLGGVLLLVSALFGGKKEKREEKD